MKTLFRIILLSLFFVLILNGAESNVGKVFPQYTAGQANWIDSLGSVLQDSIRDLMKAIFQNVRAMIHGQVTYTILGCALMLWCLNQLKNGYPTREEMWKAGKWVVMACIILAIFSSYDVFTAFIEYLTIPASWVVTSLNGVFSSQMDGKSMSEIAISLFNDVATISSVSWDKMNTRIANELKSAAGWLSFFKPDAVTNLEAMILSAFGLFPTWLMAIIFFFLGILFVAIIMFSSFMATLLLCFSPILVPLIGLPFLKSYFYSWLKLWITYTLIAPIAMLVLSIATKQISTIASKANDGATIENIVNGNQWVTYITPIITAFMCIYLLRKIPTWIQQVLGIQGAESNGLNAGAAITSAMGAAGLTATAMKASGQGGFTSSFMKALPGGQTTGALAGGAMKGLGSLGGKAGGAMQSMGQSLNGGNGTMASAGKTLNAIGGATRNASRSMRRGGQSTINAMDMGN